MCGHVRNKQILGVVFLIYSLLPHLLINNDDNVWATEKQADIRCAVPDIFITSTFTN